MTRDKSTAGEDAVIAPSSPPDLTDRRAGDGIEAEEEAQKGSAFGSYLVSEKLALSVSLNLAFMKFELCTLPARVPETFESYRPKPQLQNALASYGHI